MKTTRRETLSILGTTSLALTSMLPISLKSKENSSSEGYHVATNTYPWGTFDRRTERNSPLHSDDLLGRIHKSGIEGYEPILNSPSELKGLKEKLSDHQLQMRSFYVNSTLHDSSKAEKSIDGVIEIATAARSLGAKIVVTNPSPIRWGGSENKTDDQLRIQAKAINQLGENLHDLGMQLAYHNHDAELRAGAREFHHMLTATNPDYVKLCLDAHWVYRGCGDSEVAVFDALQHYHERVVELHLRQSSRGVWGEVFSLKGDIDYHRLINFLFDNGIRPHMVLEQAVEDNSPNSLTATKAHFIGAKNLKTILS